MPGTAQLAKDGRLSAQGGPSAEEAHEDTPVWRFLCNARRAAGQDLSHAVFGPGPPFQAPVERLHPVDFSKTKSLVILLTETAKN